MQRVGVIVAVSLGLILSSAGAALADPSPGPTIPVPAAVAPTTACTVPSTTRNLTGIVATSSGYVVVNEADGHGNVPYITYLNSDCTRSHTRSYASPPHDPEDALVDKNGTIWVADVGDPDLSRPTVAVWKVPASGPIVIYRFTYPNSTPHLAKAMVLDGDGRPIIITQPASAAGPSELFEPAAGPLTPGTPVPLKDVGSFTPEDTGTPNKLAGPGRFLVTGGADSPDGTKVALRTYSDAYEFTVSGGDVVSAITTTKPVITPMPNEALGEAIAFSADGKRFVTVSNVTTSTPILSYAQAKPVVPKATGSGAKASNQSSAIATWLKSLSLNELKVLLASIALLGLVLVIVGVVGIRRSRARYRAAAVADRSGGGGPGAARTPVATAAGAYGGPNGPGGPPPGPGGPGGGVYGAPGGNPGPNQGPPNPGHGGGNVYGGAPASGGPAGGNVYGGPRGGYDPTPADRYAAPARPAGPPQGGGYADGNYSGGGYAGGQYGAPVDPYQPEPYPAADPYQQPDPYQAGPYQAGPYQAEQPYQGGSEYGTPVDGRRRPPDDYR
jgi:hypothetical protein